MSAERVAEVIRRFAAEVAELSTLDQQCVWDILTSLRGPDNGDAMLKHDTTQVIRGMTPFRDLADVSGATVSDGPYVPKDIYVRGDWHFASHANRGYEAAVRLFGPEKSAEYKRNI